jgi:hypothetical protein
VVQWNRLSILAVSLSTIVFPLCGGCRVADDDVNSKTRYSLVFERYMFGLSQRQRFAMHVNPAAGKYGSITNLSGDSTEMETAVRNVIPNGRLVRVLDVSPDGTRMAVLLSMDNLPRHEGSWADSRFLVVRDGNDFRIEQEIAGGNAFYFADTNSICYFDQNWHIMEADVLPFKGREIAYGPTFFLDRLSGRLVIFDESVSNKGRIVEIDPAHGYAERVIGRYRDLAYDAGVIDSEWAYFITKRSAKGGPNHLFFLNLRTYNVVTYPHDFPEARLVGAAPSPE